MILLAEKVGESKTAKLHEVLVFLLLFYIQRNQDAVKIEEEIDEQKFYTYNYGTHGTNLNSFSHVTRRTPNNTNGYPAYGNQAYGYPAYFYPANAAASPEKLSGETTDADIKQLVQEEKLNVVLAPNISRYVYICSQCTMIQLVLNIEACSRNRRQ